MPADSSHGPRRSPGRFASVLLAVLVAAALAVLLGLGSWQWQRLGEKEALVARIEQRITAPPVPLPAAEAWPTLEPEAVEFRRVAFEATFRHDDEIHVFITLGAPRGPIGGQGYFVLTPAELGDGRIVFVNRGFVPLAAKDPGQRIEGQVEGRQSIAGLIRPGEQGTWITPAPDAVKNVWFARDPVAMAEARGIDPALVAPFTVDQERVDLPGGLPQGGETVVSFPNNHLQYALTWFGLAGALVAVYLVYLFKDRRRTPRGESDDRRV